MLLRSITIHVRDQNWFAVFLDFFIVVAGILIAFQITNWNEARQTKADLVKAEKAIKRDLYLNYVVSKERISLRECRIKNLQELSNQLLKPGDTWQGMSQRQSRYDELFAIDRVLRSPSRPWGSRIWNAELAQGTFRTMDSERRELLDSIFSQSDDQDIRQNNILDGQASLKVLSNTLELSRSDRLRYYDIVAKIDENSYWVELVAGQIIRDIEALNIDFTEAEAKRLLELSGSVFDLEERKEFYGDCVKPITIPWFETANIGN